MNTEVRFKFDYAVDGFDKTVDNVFLSKGQPALPSFRVAGAGAKM